MIRNLFLMVFLLLSAIDAVAADPIPRFLPLDPGGAVIHFWNSSPVERTATVLIGGSTILWKAAPDERVIARLFGTVGIVGDPSIKVWIESAGAVVEAVEPAETWRAIVEDATGIGLANGGAAAVDVEFFLRTADGRSLRTNGTLSPRSAVAFFASLIFPGERGTLAIVASAPIAAISTACGDGRCATIPIGGGGLR